METVFKKVIDEVRAITEEQVAKKQDAAKMNFPNIIEKIKTAASMGETFCIVQTNQMNVYDKALLIAEGFGVSLVDKKITRYDLAAQFNPLAELKEWRIAW